MEVSPPKNVAQVNPKKSPFVNRESAERDLNVFLQNKSIIGTIFTGWYTDRIWVEEIREYRDRIRIDAAEENEFIKNLKGVLRRVKRLELGMKFCGLERNEDDHVSILLNWDESSSQPFGHFWYMIDSVQFKGNSLEWTVKVLRSVLQSDSSGQCPHCKKFPTDSIQGADREEHKPLDMTEIANNLQRKFCEFINPVEWYHDAKPYLNWNNFLNALRFVAILIMAFITGLGQMLPKLWQLLNATIRESGQLLKQMMPFLLACVEMVNKIVGGFYLLLAMLWRDTVSKKNSSPSRLGNPALENKSRIYAEGSRYPYNRENVQRPYLRSQFQ